MIVQPLEVAAQHEQRLAQRGQLTVALLAGASRNIGGQQENFLGQEFCTDQLDQLENAANLLQVLDRLLQQADIVPLGDELLETLFRLLDGGEQLAAHQPQGRGSTYHAPCAPPTR
ncbi:hypothetical protein D3C78_1219410 [compost metagenome]